MSYTDGLRCRLCGTRQPIAPAAICEACFGPLEVQYRYEEIRRDVRREEVERRPRNIWRYAELLPLEHAPSTGEHTGFTPLRRARRLGEKLGLRELYIKNDGVVFPTLSFKDRVVAVALSKAIEFDMNTVACASTGNLANAVAAQAAAAGLPAYLFIPDDLEHAKVIASQIYGARVIGFKGNYDDVNRLCTEVADRFGWAMVNVNLRPFYAEGSKTVGFEIVEQLGWRTPDVVVVPMAGGSLLTKIHKGFEELTKLGWIDRNEVRMCGAQATGCNPISAALKNGLERIKPVKPDTIAKSIAIGNPADGFFALQTIRSTGGWAEDASDREIVDGIRLLAETEGVFTETAGGTTVAVARKLVEQGRIRSDEVTVLAITGNGLKTIEAIDQEPPPSIPARIRDLEKLLETQSMKRQEAIIL
ncbi:MAG: threonine synthase [Acidobacteria bacterium]|nr:threonine synthase [Acidobacteriota bacterium]